MRRFLLYFSVLSGIVLLLCLLPGTQRLFGSEAPVPPPAPVRSVADMPALLMDGSAAEQRHWAEARQHPVLRQSVLGPRTGEDGTPYQIPADLHDANGNALSRRSHRHSVYQTFILGDMMG